MEGHAGQVGGLSWPWAVAPGRTGRAKSERRRKRYIAHAQATLHIYTSSLAGGCRSRAADYKKEQDWAGWHGASSPVS